MIRRPGPVRCEGLIDAPEAAVRRALWRSDVWVRTARAVGGRLEVAGGACTLDAAGMVRFAPAHGHRPMVLRVGQSGGLPMLESAGARRSEIRIALSMTSTSAGVLTTVELVVRTAVPGWAAAYRPWLERGGEMLLGIAILAAREPVRVVAGAVIVGGTVLLARRKSVGPTAGRWELPGGKLEPGETDRQALARELQEELGVRTRVWGRIGPVIEVEPGVQLRCYRAEMAQDDPIRLVDHDEYRWVGSDELTALDLLDADRLLTDSLRVELQSQT